MQDQLEYLLKAGLHEKHRNSRRRLYEMLRSSEKTAGCASIDSSVKKIEGKAEELGTWIEKNAKEQVIKTQFPQKTLFSYLTTKVTSIIWLKSYKAVKLLKCDNNDASKSTAMSAFPFRCQGLGQAEFVERALALYKGKSRNKFRINWENRANVFKSLKKKQFRRSVERFH